MSHWHHALNPIGYIDGCFPKKYATPRQPGLAPHAEGRIVLEGAWFQAACRGLEEFSHIIVIFGFQIESISTHATIRPPRFAGKKRIGIFASRSPHRPNPIGLSIVRLNKIESIKNITYLSISGIDMINGTPVLDIKPYVPYADCIPSATASWAQEPARFDVQMSSEAEATLLTLPENVRHLITEIISLDPRDGAQKKNDRTSVFTLLHYDITWTLQGTTAYVESIHLLKDVDSGPRSL